MAVAPAGCPGSGEWRCDGTVGHSGTPLDSLGRALRTLGTLTWATQRARTRGGQIAVFPRREMEK
jgi:hypothetical protein